MACIANALMVGGGIAGLASAIALQKAGVQCDVVEIAPSALGWSPRADKSAAVGDGTVPANRAARSGAAVLERRSGGWSVGQLSFRDSRR